jgi:hypothetical protein
VVAIHRDTADARLFLEEAVTRSRVARARA